VVVGTPAPVTPGGSRRRSAAKARRLVRTMTWLLIWAVSVIVVDAAVIVRHDDRHASASRSTSSQSTSSGSSTSTGASGSADDTTTTTSAPATSSTGGDGGATTTSPPSVETTPNGDVVVAHLQGDGETLNSVGFHVDGHWQLRWHVDPGNGVAATVDNDDVPANDPHHSVLFAGLKSQDSSPAEGTIDLGVTCNCTLHLTPDGSSYDVLVVDVVD